MGRAADGQAGRLSRGRKRNTPIENYKGQIAARDGEIDALRHV